MLCNIEYLNPDKGWILIVNQNMIDDPARYAAMPQPFTFNTYPARVVECVTGVVHKGECCPHCEDQHLRPYDGSCLI